MLSCKKSNIFLLISIFLVILNKSCDARMLPTRSNDDKLDKLRDLLRDILESDLDPRMKANEKRSDFSVDDYRSIKDMISQRAYPSYSMSPSLVGESDLKYVPFKRSVPARLYGNKISTITTK